MARVFSAPIIGQSAASGAQVIDGSLKFDNNYLTRTPGSEGNFYAWTWSAWVKPDRVSGNLQNIFEAKSDGSNYDAIYFTSGQALEYELYRGSQQAVKITNRVFRDTGWYHLVVVYDAANSTADDRVRIYVNGERETSFSSSTNPDTEDKSFVNDNSIVHQIGDGQASNQEYDGRLSQVYLIDGQALDASYFGFTDPLTNTWKPKKFNVAKADDTVLVGSPTYASSDFKTEGNKTSDQTGLSFGAWTSYTGAETKIFKNSTDTVFTLNLYLSGGTTDRLLWYSNNLTDWTFVGNTNPNRYYQLSGFKYYATSEGSGSTTLEAISENGPNSFYLPMDGNSPIGQDKSGNGNDFTPFNFGGSVALDNPQVSGARPILNTTPGGSQAGVGVFGSKENKYYTLTGSSGSGSGYVFENEGTKPTLSMIRGATYTFDYSAASSHPFRFATAADAAGSTQYTTGTSVSGNVIKFTVPHDAPDTLHYYCTNHGGMGNSISVTTDNTKADQYASNCVLALPLLGNKEDVSTSIACTSSTRAVSASGNAAAAYESSNFYAGSFEFDGSGDYLDVTESDNCFDFGTGDFTIELWALCENNNELIGTANNSAFLGSNKGGWVIRRFDSGIKFNYQYNSSWVFENTFGSEEAKDKWNHIAITRSGSTIRCFSNGVQQGSDYTSSANIVSTEGYCRVGGGYNSTSLLVDGYLQDVRIYKGVAKYTSDFIVPATSPNILPNTPSGVSGGSKLTKITDGAVSFDGTNDKLSVTAHSDLDLSSGDFTVEGFVYPLRSQEQAFVNNWNSGGQFQVQMSSSGTLQASWAPYSLSDYAVTGTTPVRVNAWSHFAYTRSGSTFELFLDGVSQGTQTSSANGSTNNNIVLGENGGNADRDFQGFLSNVRIIKGTALYTSNFTPPTKPLTEVTNTKLLCCQSNTQAGAAATAPTMGGVNNGIQWSSGISNAASSYPGTNLFDGSTSTYTEATQGGGDVTFSGNISGTTIEIYGNKQGSSTLTINGVDKTSLVPSSAAYFTITGVTEITSMAFNRGASGNYVDLYAIRVDGVVLRDPLTPNGNAAATNFNPFITDINTVRGQESGYATWNPLANYGLTLANGNLDWQGGTNQRYCRPTLFADSGKWYCEFHMRSTSHIPGIIREDHKDAAGNLGELASSRFQSNGTIGYSGGNTVTGGTTWAAGDCVQLFMDMDNKAIYWGVNGIMKIGDDGNSGDPLSGSNYTGAVIYPGVDSLTDRISEKAWGPAAGTPSANDTSVYSSVNFGQKPFKYAPPEGYQPWNTANIRPETVISRPDKFVGIATYVGNSTGQSITMGFKPDLLWIKSRTNSGAPAWMDSVRGSNKQLNTNNQNAESTNSATAGVLSFDSNGFTLGTESSATGSTNGSQSYVAWGWKAGGGKSGGGGFFKDDVEYASAAAAGLTGGDRTLSAASVNTKTGFSILKWTNGSTTTPSSARVPHGLTQSPDFVIYKDVDSTTANWAVKSESFSNPVRTEFYFDSTDQAPTAGVDLWFRDSDYIGHRETSIGSNGNPMMAYCWHDVPGLQKFGKYFGNSSADGPFIELGFRPALLIVRRIEDNGHQMVIFDSGRTKINRSSNDSAYLRSPDASSEGTANNVDFLSDGFKWRKSDSYTNDSGSSTGFIYAAWAEAPSVDLFGGGANAR